MKTRLAAGCGPEAARNLYILMAEMIARDLAPQPGDDHRLILYVAPGDAAPRVREWLFPGEPNAHDGVTVIAQPETTLDLRMQHAIDLAGGPVVLLGTDCPGVCRGDIARIGAFLKVVDAVVGAANDGGFWTLGLARSQPHLLDGLPTSESSTVETLRKRLEERGLRTLDIEDRVDIDTVDDLFGMDAAVRLRLAAEARKRALLVPEEVNA